MKRLLASAAVIAFGLTASAAAQDKIIVEFAYPYSHLFDITYEKILPKFYAENPGIEIRMRATYESYEDGTNTILREAVAGDLPDVTMQGLNRQAILVDKGIARSLEPFIAKEADFAKDGYHRAMLKLGTFNGEVHGLPFSVSLPVGYYNMDLMAKAGYEGVEDLPRTWDEVVTACDRLKEAGVKTPMFWAWNITGNWFLQALMWSQDKPIVDGDAVNLDAPEALVALETMHTLFRGCRMPNYDLKGALAAFAAGEVAMNYWSTSAVGTIERTKGDFTFRTNEFPGLVADGPKGLPAGGNAAMLVSTSDDPKELEAAWKWLKFITSGEGAAEVARTTGYMPPNKAANEIILADFYDENPNKKTAVRQLPLLREWFAYPGDKGLAITQVIYDAIESVVIGDADDIKALREEMVEEVTGMLPNS